MPRLNAAGTAWESHPSDQQLKAPPPLMPQSGKVANAIATATLAAVVGKTNYITGFEVWAGGATAGALVDVTISGLAGGSRTYPYSVPAGATNAATPLLIVFPAPLPASAANVAITVTLPALGVGNAAAQVNAYGFQL
jgi:hypothetical protein